jgi:hypothetical protein
LYVAPSGSRCATRLHSSEFNSQDTISLKQSIKKHTLTDPFLDRIKFWKSNTKGLSDTRKHLVVSMQLKIGWWYHEHQLYIPEDDKLRHELILNNTTHQRPVIKELLGLTTNYPDYIIGPAYWLMWLNISKAATRNKVQLLHSLPVPEDKFLNIA